MCVAVAAAGHDEPLAGVIDHLGLALLDEGLGPGLVADIDVLAVFHCKCLDEAVGLGGEHLAIYDEVGTVLLLASSEHASSGDECGHGDA